MIPALLTRIWRRPKCSIVELNNARTSSGLLTAARMATASPPAARIVETPCSAASRRRPRPIRRRNEPADSLQVLERYGVVIPPALVVAEQIGVPLPAVPALLAVGARAAHGRLSIPLVLGAISMAPGRSRSGALAVQAMERVTRSRSL